MNLYADTEFNGFGGELISFALVPETPIDGIVDLYVVVQQKEPYVPWVAQNVVPLLGDTPAISRADAAKTLAAYLSMFDNPTIVADWPEDLSLLLDLLITGPGMMVGCLDFDMRYRSCHGFNTAQESKIPHNALWDARALRDHFISRI